MVQQVQLDLQELRAQLVLLVHKEFKAMLVHQVQLDLLEPRGHKEFKVNKV